MDGSVAGITFDEVKTGDNSLAVTYAIKGNETKSVLNFALVQNKVITPIKAGENNGVNLTNYNAVRKFKSIPSPTGEQILFPLTLFRILIKKI